MEVLPEIGDAEETEMGTLKKLLDFIQKKHPDEVAPGRATSLFNYICLTHFRNILKMRKKQILLGRFLSKTPANERKGSVAKRAKIYE